MAEVFLRVHALLHVPFKDSGSSAPCLARYGRLLRISRLYQEKPLSNPKSFGLLIATGGMP
jgi:hypothetical protein